MKQVRNFLVLLCVLALNTQLSFADQYYDESTLVKLGERTPVWGVLCKDLYCAHSLCFRLQNKNGQPATAKIAVEATFHDTLDTVATNDYCTPLRSMTFFMSMTVWVEPITEDVNVMITKKAPL